MSSQKTIDETLQPYVEKALQGLEKGTEFAIDMAPELLQEFYMWHTWSYIFWMAVWLVLFFLCKWFYNTINRRRIANEDDWADDPGYVLGAVFCYGGYFGAAIGFLSMLHNFVYLLVAPKIYLIDYFLN